MWGPPAAIMPLIQPLMLAMCTRSSCSSAPSCWRCSTSAASAALSAWALSSPCLCCSALGLLASSSCSWLTAPCSRSSCAWVGLAYTSARSCSSCCCRARVVIAAPAAGASAAGAAPAAAAACCCCLHVPPAPALPASAARAALLELLAPPAGSAALPRLLRDARAAAPLPPPPAPPAGAAAPAACCRGGACRLPRGVQRRSAVAGSVLVHLLAPVSLAVAAGSIGQPRRLRRPLHGLEGLRAALRRLEIGAEAHAQGSVQAPALSAIIADVTGPIGEPGVQRAVAPHPLPVPRADDYRCAEPSTVKTARLLLAWYAWYGGGTRGILEW
jgi:hypothetical protein